MLKNINHLEAQKLLLGLAAAPRTERVELSEALGRVLAEDFRTRIDIPPFDRSPYDGYAFRGEDTAGASAERPAKLKITEEIPAGGAPSMPVGWGEAAKILTGAPIPEGANATVKYELTQFDAEYVSIPFPIAAGTDIIRAGEDTTAGSLLARRGDVITPGLLGEIAAQGESGVAVCARPTVALFSTGSELLSAGEEPAPGKIYNSSAHVISAYIRKIGANVRFYGNVPDDPDLISSLLLRAAGECDCVITTGGASVGDYDWALETARRAGAKLLFHKADVKPGGALVASELGGKLILNLSGSPGAAVIALLVFGMPYLKALCGRRECAWRSIRLRLGAPFRKKSPRVRFLRGHMDFDGGSALFIPNEGQTNGALGSFIDCDLLGVLPAGSPPLDAGAEIEAYIIKFD